ncbi:DNA adenine methylase [Candidatus Parcubacteria bacterium]|nr:MAG: DNA adenine methylase [Candidatus Parcubacteria bacterium]
MQLGLPLENNYLPSAQPFLKWAGGKRALLPRIAPLIPSTFRVYHEPFLGGGAVFWELTNRRARETISFQGAILSDSNEELILTYQVVRDSLDALLPLLAEHQKKHSKSHYYTVRALNPATLSPLERAARFIYLNKTCYNGLYRVNRSGKFNVPMGSYKNPKIFMPEILQSASAALQGIKLICQDFTHILEQAQAGDFIYFDPPYVPLSETSSFTSYTSRNFGRIHHERLAQIFRILDKRGCKIMLSNSDTPFTRALYHEYRCLTVHAPRAINTKPNGRGKISELLVLNYEPVS